MTPRSSGLSRQFLASLSLALLAVTFALCRLRPLYYIDVWWHLATGEYIVNHLRVPTTDVFSWTVYGASWINTEWLYEVVLYGLVRAMGLAGVMFLKTALMLTALYFMDRRLRLWKASVFEQLVLLGLAFMAGWPFWVELADLTSLALLSALLFDIDRGLFIAGRLRKTAYLWIFLFALWPNTHGAFLVGLFAVGLKWLIQMSSSSTSKRPWSWWAGACAAATLVNPYGIGLYGGIYKNMSVALDQILGWLPPSGLGFLFFYLVLALSLMSAALKKKWTREDLYAALIVLVFGGYALRHGRFVHFFSVCAFPYAARQWLTSPWRPKFAALTVRWEKTALTLSSVLLLMTSIAAARRVQGGINAAESGYVKRACEFIASEKIQGPFYNDFKFGSYWIWHFKGDPPVFQDGRHATVLGYERVVEATSQAQRSPATWIAYIDQLRVQASLVRYPPETQGLRPAAFDRFFPRTTWGLVYWDDLCLLFVRRTPQNAALLKQWEYRVIKPEWTLDTFQDQLRSGRLNKKAARRELEKNLALNPECRRAQAGLYWLDHAIQ